MLLDRANILPGSYYHLPLSSYIISHLSSILYICIKRRRSIEFLLLDVRHLLHKYVRAARARAITYTSTREYPGVLIYVSSDTRRESFPGVDGGRSVGAAGFIPRCRNEHKSGNSFLPFTLYARNPPPHSFPRPTPLSFAPVKLVGLVSSLITGPTLFHRPAFSAVARRNYRVPAVIRCNCRRRRRRCCRRS